MLLDGMRLRFLKRWRRMPTPLKASVPGKNVLEVSFGSSPTGWVDALKALPEVEGVTEHDGVYRIATGHGPATTRALLDKSAGVGLEVKSLSVQSTTLDDVFVHYAGRALRDALQDAKSDFSHVFRR